MPRYYFHVSDGHDFTDQDGIELADLSTVKSTALSYAGELLRDSAQSFWTGERWQMRVVDERGSTMLNLSFTAMDLTQNDQLPPVVE